MTTKQMTMKPDAAQEGSRVAFATTAVAWVLLGIGLALCLFNLGDFTDSNLGLMVGVGFLVGSVHIYVIGTAMRLVHSREAKLRS